MILHLGGYMTRQLDISGFNELFVMHIPRANLPLTSPTLNTLETSWRDSDGELTSEGAMVNDGSITT